MPAWLTAALEDQDDEYRAHDVFTSHAAVPALRVQSAALVVLVLALYTLAGYLAAGETHRTLRDVGWALVLVELVVPVARRLAGEYAVNALTSPRGRRAARLIGS